MTNPTLILALAVACLAMQGCILFTSPVNEPPKVEVLPLPAAARGEKVTVTANASDPDGDPPRVEWSTGPAKDCDRPLDASKRPASTYSSTMGTATFPFVFEGGAPSTVCVWALAIDAQGATAVDARTISSENLKPVAAIKVLAPTKKAGSGHYELYSYFRLSATGSTDPDGDEVVVPKWELPSFPDKAVPQPKLVPCPNTASNDFVRCLDAGGFAGDYTIELTVGDGMLRSDVASLTLTVDDDHPACVAATVPNVATSPLVLDPGEGKTFSITQILDDGAPFPTPADGAHATPTFSWRVRRNAGAWQPIVGYEQLAALTLPKNSYATGDVVDVSVTISDGLTTHAQTACDPLCPANCPQSAQWTVEYR
jgi:hypothetical protein